MSIETRMPSNHLIHCCPFLLLPSVFPSIRVFSNESPLHIMWTNIGASALASVIPMNIQGWVPLGLTGLISWQSTRLSKSLWKHQFFGTHASLWSSLHICVCLLGKPQLWLYGPLLAKWYLCSLKLSSFVIAFLPRGKRLLILWLQSPSAVVLNPKTIKSVTLSTFPHLFTMEW